MSEYQYYEFVAIDRPLSASHMDELRRLSTRATITRTTFVNHYEWGDFKGDPAKLMERYFDAFLYFANWGTRQVMLAMPSKGLDLRLLKRCSDQASACVRARDGRVVLQLSSDLEGADDDIADDGQGSLASLIHVRSEILAGDHRALYLAWLLGVDQGARGDDAKEPFVPERLGRPTAALASLAEFLRLDEDLRAAAALPTSKPRTAGQLRAAAEVSARERRRLEAARAERAARRQARADAAARAQRLTWLARREAAAWQEAAALVATKKASAYDQAVALLVDLRELAERSGRLQEATSRIGELCLAHLSQRALIERCRRAGLA